MTSYKKALTQMRWGLLLALLTLAFGFFMGILFGGFETELKKYLESEALSVSESPYNGDDEHMKKVLSKSWVYFKRAHLHANGLGTTAISLIVVMTFLNISAIARSVIALALGIGAFGYSLFWMVAGMNAPGLGSTDAAKESLTWLAVPTAALCVVGLLAVIILAVIELLFRCKSGGLDVGE